MRVKGTFASFSAVCLAAVGVLIGGSAPALLRPVTAASSAITFSTPTLADADHANGEPDIGIDAQGRVFTSGPTGTGTQRSMWYGSTDRGHTFSEISAGLPPSVVSGTTQPPGGGDTELKFDHTGKQYFADLYALACFRTATTSDGGATVQGSTAGGCEGSGPGADRQWISVFDPPAGTTKSPYTGPVPLIYLDYNDLGATPPTFFYPNGGSQWNKSTDGLNYFQAINGQPAGTALANWAPFGPDGYPAIDQVTGDVFEAAGFQNPDKTWSMLLNIGTPDSTGNLTFLDQSNAGTVTPTSPAQLLIHIADGLPANPDTLFSVLSMDSARNLILAWASGGDPTQPAQRQTFVSAASAASGWRTWTKPVQVSSAPSMVSVFPWVKAGGPGRADAVWYGSNVLADPSTDAGQAWDVYMAQVVFPVDSNGAITGAAPSVTQVKVTPHPMHYHTICLAGTDCIKSQGNRNLADFFEVTVDSTGAAEIVYDDTSNGLVQPGFTPDNQQLVDHAGAPIVTIARQASGLGVFGTSVSGSSNAPRTGITDNSGDARYPLISGSNIPGLDLLSSSITLSKGVLNVRTQIADLSGSGIATAITQTASTNLQYVTRWQMGNTIYYAAMETTAAGGPTFYAGKAGSVDLCSVSACFPHVITYPEPGHGGTQESGSVKCPAQPSASNPCLLTVQVNAGDVGAPSNSSLLEEVGAYSFASAVQSGAITNAQAQADEVPLEIDGACCYNTQPPTSAPLPVQPADGNGHVKSQNGQIASFTSDEDPLEDGLGPTENFSDGAGHTFSATNIAAVSFDDVAGTMTVTGAGTDNGLPVTFTIVELQGGALVGTYNLVLSDGYGFAGTLIDGSIQLS